MRNHLLALSRTPYTNQAGRSALRPVERRSTLHEGAGAGSRHFFGRDSISRRVEAGPAGTADRADNPWVDKHRVGGRLGVVCVSHQQDSGRLALLRALSADLWNLARAKPPGGGSARERGQTEETTPSPMRELSVPICPLALHKFVRAAMWLARAPMHLRSGCIAGLAASLWRSA